MPGRLYHPDYRTGVPFGAVVLCPGMPTAEIEAALNQVVADAMTAP